MEQELAVRRLSALAQDARLSLFRLLVTAGPEGMAAGEIARELKIQPNTLSAQLLILANARLVQARREGRSIIYAVSLDGIRELLVFLTEDCCRRSPAVCEPLAEIAAKVCCEPGTKKGVRRTASARSRRR
jgi:DNA-binding transcriptional ArsR family regulator